MRSTAIVDTGPLYAALDSDDRNHAACADVLRRRDLQFVVPSLVVTEVAYFAQLRLGAAAEAAFLRGLSAFEVEGPTPADWPLIADLVERYGDFPLGTVDASIAVLADRLETDLLVTLDRRHFGAIHSPQGRVFRLLPAATKAHEEPAEYGTELAGSLGRGLGQRSASPDRPPRGPA
jgi:predicted nucleic acid-binding protein